MDYSWHSLEAEHLDWLRDGKIRMLFQIGLVSHKDLTKVPLIIDLARNQTDRQILEVALPQL